MLVTQQRSDLHHPLHAGVYQSHRAERFLRPLWPPAVPIKARHESTMRIRVHHSLGPAPGKDSTAGPRWITLSTPGLGPGPPSTKLARATACALPVSRRRSRRAHYLSHQKATWLSSSKPYFLSVAPCPEFLFLPLAPRLSFPNRLRLLRLLRYLRDRA